MNLTRAICAGIATVLPLAGCQTRGPRFDPRAHPTVEASSLMVDAALTNRVSPQWLRPPTNLFTLGPGDRVEVELLGDTESRATTMVGPDGKVYFHLLPGVDVWGLTLAQAKARLQSEMLKFIREDPKLALGLRSAESKRVWLLGRLNAPGVYPITEPMTLLEAIAVAKGPASFGGGATLASATVTVSLSGPAEDAADLEHSFVLRHGQLLPVDFHRLLKEGDMTQNIYLEPDDFVYLSSAIARNVYVLGAVAQPKAVARVDRLSLVAAVASAGGTLKDAYLSHVAIVRGSLTSPQIAVVDYKEVVRGRAPDILLEPHDIVYVPFTPYRVLSRYVDLVLQTFVRTVGANEGTRAVVPGTAPVGPNVPIGGIGP